MKKKIIHIKKNGDLPCLTPDSAFCGVYLPRLYDKIADKILFSSEKAPHHKYDQFKKSLYVSEKNYEKATCKSCIKWFYYYRKNKTIVIKIKRKIKK